MQENVIKEFILKTQNDAQDINLTNFFEFIKIPDELGCQKTNLHLTNVTISHLSSRLSYKSILKEPLYNLTNALIKDTEIKRFFNEEGLVFVSENDKMFLNNNGSRVHWGNYNNPQKRMLIKRLESNKDNCIDGFLFFGEIYKNRRVDHIKNTPEILLNILNVLGKEEAIEKYKSKSTPYILVFQIPVTKIIFDSDYPEPHNNEEKALLIVKKCLDYLSRKMVSKWSEDDNTHIRLIDNLVVDKEMIIKVHKVDDI